MHPFRPLKLDPEFAAFYGLPGEIPFRHPEDLEPGTGSGLGIQQIARALEEAAREAPSAPTPFRSFLDNWPDISRMESCLAIGNHEFALRVARDLRSRAPELPCALLGLGIAATRLGRREEAAEALESCLALCPERLDAIVEMSLIHALEGRWDGAGLLLDRIQAIHPASADLHLYRPLVERRDASGLETVRGLVERLAAAERRRDVGETAAAAEEIVQRLPDHAEAVRRAAVALLMAGEPARAMTLALRAARLDDRSPLVQNSLAGFHLQARDFIEAERAALRARTLAPEWLPPLITLSQVLRADRRPAMAALHLEKALETRPGNLQILEFLGRSLLEAGRVDDARTRFRDIADRAPGNPLARFHLGHVEDVAGNHAAAVEHYRGACEAAPLFAEAREAMALAMARCGQEGEGRRILEELIRDRPESPFGFRGLGDLLVDSDPAEALRLFEEATRRSGDIEAAGLFFLSGNRMLLERRFSEAAALFELSLRRNPRRHQSWCNLGVARKEEGRLAEAIAAMKEAARLAPDVAGYHGNLAVFYRSAFTGNPIRNFRCLWSSLKASRASRNARSNGPVSR